MTKRTMLAQVPPMGWNSWNTFYDRFDGELIARTADAMVETGLRDAGYRYLIIDDCWSLPERDGSGRLVPDPSKFPGGLEDLIRYVHAKGLYFGLYACCGLRTCAGRPGSFEHEREDAEQFAAWGVDYLKYDNCHKPASMRSELLLRRMVAALRGTGRDILLAACQWGTENVEEWIRSTGAHTYRSTVDIRDTWDSIRSIAENRMLHLGEGGPDCFNDMDMLVAGMYGGGSNPETGASGCTSAEYRTHFALWAMLNSPLIIGCDVRNMDEETADLLMNREVIAVNQDPECRSCFRVNCDCGPASFSLIRPLAGGDYAAGLFNFSDEEAVTGLPFWELGLSRAAGSRLHFRNLFTHEDEGIFSECFMTKLPAHGCAMYRLSPVGGRE